MTRVLLRDVMPDLVPRSAIRVTRTPSLRYTTARIEVDITPTCRVVALRFHRSKVDHPAVTYFNRPRNKSPLWELYVVADGYLEQFVRYAESWEAEHLDRAVADYDPAVQLSRLQQYVRHTERTARP